MIWVVFEGQGVAAPFAWRRGSLGLFSRGGCLPPLLLGGGEMFGPLFSPFGAMGAAPVRGREQRFPETRKRNLEVLAGKKEMP